MLIDQSLYITCRSQAYSGVSMIECLTDNLLVRFPDTGSISHKQSLQLYFPPHSFQGLYVAAYTRTSSSESTETPHRIPDSKTYPNHEVLNSNNTTPSPSTLWLHSKPTETTRPAHGPILILIITTATSTSLPLTRQTHHRHHQQQ